MKKLSNHLIQHPLKYSIAIVFVLIIISQLGAIITNMINPGVELIYSATIMRLFCGGLVVVTLFKLGWSAQSFIFFATNERPKYWYVIPLCLSSVGFINLVNTDWSSLHFSYSTLVFWFTDNLSTGVFEETMMRAMVFTLLLKAWGTTQKGVLQAAIVQALIFGFVHLVNLLNGFSIAVFAQVLWATFMGLGFAGAVLYGRSIWPSVAVHGFINAMANIDNYFAAQFVPEPMSPASLLALIAIMFVIAVLPGYWGITHSAQFTQLAKEAK